MRKQDLSALQEQVRAQRELLEDCLKRALAASHWRLRSAYIGEYVRLQNAFIATAFVLGLLEQSPKIDPLTAVLLANLQLPDLPTLLKKG